MAVLDTNFLIALEQRETRAEQWLAEHQNEEHFVPDIVAIEYLTGHTAHEEALEVFEASFTIAHGSLEWIRSSVVLRQTLRKRKRRFRSPDFWIAAWARHLQTSVVTRDTRHFQAFEIPVETW